jgi:hypothetical protein
MRNLQDEALLPWKSESGYPGEIWRRAHKGVLMLVQKPIGQVWQYAWCVTEFIGFNTAPENTRESAMRAAEEGCSGDLNILARQITNGAEVRAAALAKIPAEQPA